VKRDLRTPILFVSLLILLALVASACVRPIPDREESTVETPPAMEAPLVQPTPPVGEDAGQVTEPYPGVAQPPADETGAPAEQPAPETPVEPAPDATAVTGETVHVVQPGETLFTLAQRYGLSVEEIAIANNLANVNVLDVGQQLRIPAPGTVDLSPPAAPPAGVEQIHVVQRGDNLFRIGLRYGFTVQELAAYNGIANPNRIDVGQQIRIPPRN